mmetsp:Transcript_4116/g.9893  ORF Transcript_4116/g.9893 Transcript_4116/m.9893 type:complete len:397 (+) Transcript_4116:933-2123(+)
MPPPADAAGDALRRRRVVRHELAGAERAAHHSGRRARERVPEAAGAPSGLQGGARVVRGRCHGAAHARAAAGVGAEEAALRGGRGGRPGAPRGGGRRRAAGRLQRLGAGCRQAVGQAHAGAPPYRRCSGRHQARAASVPERPAAQPCPSPCRREGRHQPEGPHGGLRLQSRARPLQRGEGGPGGGRAAARDRRQLPRRDDLVPRADRRRARLPQRGRRPDRDAQLLCGAEGEPECHPAAARPSEGLRGGRCPRRRPHGHGRPAGDPSLVAAPRLPAGSGGVPGERRRAFARAVVEHVVFLGGLSHGRHLRAAPHEPRGAAAARGAVEPADGARGRPLGAAECKPASQHGMRAGGPPANRSGGHPGSGGVCPGSLAAVWAPAPLGRVRAEGADARQR